MTSQFLEISGSWNYGIGKVLCIVFGINFTWKAGGGGAVVSVLNVDFGFCPEGLTY